MKYMVGDKVGILSNIPFGLKHRAKVRGVVTNIDGNYILVRPLWCKWETECYSCELVHEWDDRY